MAKYCNEHVRVSVCLSAIISPEPHARSSPIFVLLAYRRGSVLLRRGDAIPREGTILGVVWAIQKHWQSSLQRRYRFRCNRHHSSPVTSRSRRDHSVWQASANSRPVRKSSGRRRCGLSAAKGWWDCTLHRAGEAWYLRLSYYSPWMYSRRIIQILYGPKVRPSRVRL